MPQTVLPAHRVHDYRHLIRRWRQVAAVAGLRLRSLVRHDGYQIHYVCSPRLGKECGLYISAGIHGDEPAATEALVQWVEKCPGALTKLPCILFPCLNPWGLVQNSRLDRGGNDMNRAFQDRKHPVIDRLREVIASHTFRLALTLHEDYDAQGFYVYEPARRAPHWGEDLVRVASRHIEIDGRKTIDGRRARNGLLRKKLTPSGWDKLPEAVYLHFHHAERTFTFETPSEFALDCRVRTQVALIDACVKRLGL